MVFVLGVGDMPALAPAPKLEIHDSDTSVALKIPTPEAPTPQALCTRNHMRTIYLSNGKSWRCRK